MLQEDDPEVIELVFNSLFFRLKVESLTIGAGPGVKKTIYNLQLLGSPLMRKIMFPSYSVV